MSNGDPNNPYGQQPGYGYPQQAPQGVPQQGYGYPQQPGQPYGEGYPQQPGYGAGPVLAHWGLRFAALLIDGLILCVPYILVGIGAGIGGTGGGILGVIGFIAMIGLAIWLLYQEGTTGQTVGKKALGIRLLRESDGQPIGFGMAFVRRLAHFLDSFACYLGWLWPLWDAKKQTFADKVCSTLVVKSS
ncbi:RDD family protein [Streptomyces sp. NPDC048496]|uniref:RDD family protein n=1 Tax=Streptomyces sp. NPDC048496 TaxID=3365558 RepID=UPI0037229062